MSEHETRAVTTIQTHFRGYLARKQYSKMLLTLFEEVKPYIYFHRLVYHCMRLSVLYGMVSLSTLQEEEKRREKERKQMLEGEILIER